MCKKWPGQVRRQGAVCQQEQRTLALGTEEQRSHTRERHEEGNLGLSYHCLSLHLGASVQGLALGVTEPALQVVFSQLEILCWSHNPRLSLGYKDNCCRSRVFKGSHHFTSCRRLYGDLFSLGAKGTSSAGHWVFPKDDGSLGAAGICKSMKHTEGASQHWSSDRRPLLEGIC